MNVLLLLTSLPLAVTVDDGLLRTPAMGWMSWERFRCDTDCRDDHKNCIRWDQIVCSTVCVQYVSMKYCL